MGGPPPYDGHLHGATPARRRSARTGRSHHARACLPGDRPLFGVEVRGRRAAARASAGRTAQARAAPVTLLQHLRAGDLLTPASYCARNTCAKRGRPYCDQCPNSATASLSLFVRAEWKAISRAEQGHSRPLPVPPKRSVTPPSTMVLYWTARVLPRPAPRSVGRHRSGRRRHLP